MATKTLSQLVGGGGKEVGELVATTASALADGKVLLDCDGSSFNTTTYPELAAIISATRGLGPVRVFKRFQGMRLVTADHYAVSPDGTQALGVTNQFLAPVTTPLGGGATLVDDTTPGYDSAANSTTRDRTGQCYFITEAQKGFLEIETSLRELVLKWSETDNGQVPGSSRIIDTVDLHDHEEDLRKVPCGASLVYSSDTLEALACDIDSTGHVDLFYGTNAGGFWDDAAWPLQAQSALTYGNDYLEGYGAADSAILKSLWPTSVGLFISTDTGVSWAVEGARMPNNTVAIAVAIDSTDIMYALSPDQVAKSTNDGAAWSGVLDVLDINVPLPVDYSPIKFRDVKVDSSDRVYVLGDANNGRATVAILYVSTDAGVTWTYMVQPFVDPAGVFDGGLVTSGGYKDYRQTIYTKTNSALGDESQVHAEFYRMQLKPDGSKIYVNDRRGFTLYEADITAGSFLPYLPGYKVVAA